MHPHGTEKSELLLFYKDTGPILRVLPLWLHLPTYLPTVPFLIPWRREPETHHSIQAYHHCFSPDANQLWQKEDSKDRMDRVVPGRRHRKTLRIWSQQRAGPHLGGRVWRTQPGEMLCDRTRLALAWLVGSKITVYPFPVGQTRLKQVTSHSFQVWEFASVSRAGKPQGHCSFCLIMQISGI